MKVTFEGTEYVFPEDATQEEIFDFLLRNSEQDSSSFDVGKAMGSDAQQFAGDDQVVEETAAVMPDEMPEQEPMQMKAPSMFGLDMPPPQIEGPVAQQEAPAPTQPPLRAGMLTEAAEEKEEKPTVLHGKQAIKKVEEDIGRPLTYAEKRVVEEEGWSSGNYKDTKGIETSGVGQTGKYKGMSFEETFNEHAKETKRMIPNLDKYPEYLQAELIQAAYRGDLQGSPTFRKLLNSGQYDKAASEFLNHKEYKTTESTGIKRRLEKVAEAVKRYAKEAG